MLPLVTRSCLLFILLLTFCWLPNLSAQMDRVATEATDDELLLQEGVVLGLEFIKENKEYAGDALPQPPEGSRVYLMRGERGENENRQMLLYLSQGSLTNPARGVKHVDKKMTEEYQIIQTGKPISRDWLQPGAILGLHHVKLKPDVDLTKFENFIHRIWSPTQSDALPDSKIIYLQSLSGDREGQFSFLWLIDSEETRDYYFPESEVPSKMYTEFEKGWSWLNDENYLGKYLADPSEQIFTDFIVVR